MTLGGARTTRGTADIDGPMRNGCESVPGAGMGGCGVPHGETRVVPRRGAADTARAASTGVAGRKVGVGDCHRVACTGLPLQAAAAGMAAMVRW